MSPISSADSFALAKKHLERVQYSRVQYSWDPPEWLDLAAYGLYAIEAAVVAAALHLRLPLQRNHWSKADAARELSKSHGLPEVAELMKDLNDVRKSEAYGDMSAQRHLDAEDVAREIEEYIDAVAVLLGADKGN
jgi:hypothetical protein